MQLLATHYTETYYAIIDFKKRSWFCEEGKTHYWKTYSELLKSIENSDHFVPDEVVNTTDPYMKNFDTVESYIAAINSDLDNIQIAGFYEFSSLSDLENYIELTI